MGLSVLDFLKGTKPLTPVAPESLAEFDGNDSEGYLWEPLWEAAPFGKPLCLEEGFERSFRPPDPDLVAGAKRD